MDLLKEGHTFSFLQAVRLIRRLSSSYGSGTEDNLMRIRPGLSLAFPSADIERISETDLDPPLFEIVVHFLGLYGSSSPLPTFYTEELMDEAADDESASRDFLDIINQRLYDLFYAACTKYHLAFQVVEEESGKYLERLFALAGIGNAQMLQNVSDPHRLLRYIGLFSQNPRSAMGLETLLRDALGGLPVRVDPCVERKARIAEDQRLHLGSANHPIGINAVLGEEMTDRMGTFTVSIGPVDFETFERFFPGGADYETTCFLTDFYGVEGLAYDIEVTLAEGQARSVRLGDPQRSGLGLNTWVFSTDRIGEFRRVYTPHRAGG